MGNAGGVAGPVTLGAVDYVDTANLSDDFSNNKLTNTKLSENILNARLPKNGVSHSSVLSSLVGY